MQNFEHINSLLIADSEHITGGSSISIPCTCYTITLPEKLESHEQASLLLPLHCPLAYNNKFFQADFL